MDSISNQTRRLLRLHSLFAIVTRCLFVSSVALATALLAGCESTTFVRGNMPSEYQIGQIQIGKTTMDEVVESLGTPSVRSSADPNYWFYTSQTVSNHPVAGSKLLDQKVLMVKFGQFERVETVQPLEVGTNGILTPLNRTTNITLREFSLIDQAISTFLPEFLQ